MDVDGVNAFEVETALSPVETLNKETRDNIMKLPKPKVSQTRKGAMQTCVAKMVLLSQMDQRRLKLEPES